MISGPKALDKLLEGNKRFAEHKSIHPNIGSEVREALANEQKPFAVILSCSDSRVPVEIIFDVGLGDIFVIRTAGHVLSKEVLGSIEYAVKRLDVKLVMILGHDFCGAVDAALSTYKLNTYNELSDNLQSLLNHLFPVFDGLDFKDSDENLLSCAIKSNIKYQLNDLIKKDKYLAEKAEAKEIMLVGANYNLKTGFIEVLESV